MTPRAPSAEKMATEGTASPPINGGISQLIETVQKPNKGRVRQKELDNVKRRCVSTACIACRKRKSKCDGNLPSCAACASVYGTECVYDPNSDHRRKGVYKKDIDNLRTRNTTLQTLLQGILNFPEDEAIDLLKEIRSTENLDDVAELVIAREASRAVNANLADDDDQYAFEAEHTAPRFETELSGKMGELRLETDAIRFIGGTSNLLFDDSNLLSPDRDTNATLSQQYIRREDAVRSWTNVTGDVQLILHLLNMYFTWHYTYFTTLSKYMFFRDFFHGKPIHGRRNNAHCTPLLVNAILALGCHFTSWTAARENPTDASTAGDHFFKEAKRLFVDNDEYESPRLTTVQALALMSVREAGCGRESRGWVYSGMSFRMACDLGLSVGSEKKNLDEYENDARRITFWGCYLFDKCWSNYLGRPPQLYLSNISVPKFDVFPNEDADIWSPWTDTGLDRSSAQPSRTRAVALLISALCEISEDIQFTFYRLGLRDKGMRKETEIKRLSELHDRLETWQKKIPLELEPREGQLPHVLTMHMFFNLLYIHLFRPLLKHANHTGGLPPHVQPRQACTQAATTISKLLRMYKRTHGLRQICNIVVYMVHSASTIHLLNLPDKEASRDIVHSLRGLEEISESWLCARRALLILDNQAQKWKVELPGEASAIFGQTRERYGQAFSPRPNSDNAHYQSQISPSLSSLSMMSFNHMTQPSLPLATSHDNPLGIQPSMGDSNSLPPASGLFDSPAVDVYNNVEPSPPGGSVSTYTPQSTSHIVAGSHTGREDHQNWWSKDILSTLDQWPGSNTAPAMALDASNSTQGQSWNNVLMGMSNGMELNSAGMEASNAGVNANEPYELDYLNFSFEDVYGYQDGGNKLSHPSASSLE